MMHSTTPSGAQRTTETGALPTALLGKAPVAAQPTPVSMEMRPEQKGTSERAERLSGEHQHGQQQERAARIRGGGAAKDCFLGVFGAFVCFECCEGCCECIADIVCCPCEMIC